MVVCARQKLLRSCPARSFQNVSVRLQGPVGGHTQAASELESIERLVVFTGGAGGAAVLPFLKRLALHRQQQLYWGGVLPPPHTQHRQLFASSVAEDSLRSSLESRAHQQLYRTTIGPLDTV